MKIRIAPLDVLFSRFIRARAGWKCERCLKQYRPPTASLQCSHFHGRRKKSVRFDPENAAALCFGCHRIFTENPLLHVQWFKKRIGEKRFDALTLRANIGPKPDYDLLKIWYTKQLEQMELS